MRIEPGVEAQFALTIVEDTSGRPLGAGFGAAWSIDEYNSEGRSNLDVSVSSWFYHQSLDDWYEKSDFDFHTILYGNIGGPYLVGSSQNDNGSGMVFRLGDRNVPTHHFGRILIHGGSDELHLKGIAPNRYVEVEISYGGENIPYA